LLKTAWKSVGKRCSEGRVWMRPNTFKQVQRFVHFVECKMNTDISHQWLRMLMCLQLVLKNEAFLAYFSCYMLNMSYTWVLNKLIYSIDSWTVVCTTRAFMALSKILHQIQYILRVGYMWLHKKWGISVDVYATCFMCLSPEGLTASAFTAGAWLILRWTMRHRGSVAEI